MICYRSLQIRVNFLLIMSSSLVGLAVYDVGVIRIKVCCH